MRDTIKYRYIQVGLPRTQVLECLEQEAQARGVPFATHIMDLLVDRHDALHGRKGVWFPRGVQIVASPLGMRDTTPEEVDETVVEENLAVFAGFFDDDEEDSPTEKMHAV